MRNPRELRNGHLSYSRKGGSSQSQVASCQPCPAGLVGRWWEGHGASACTPRDDGNWKKGEWSLEPIGFRWAGRWLQSWDPRPHTGRPLRSVTGPGVAQE